MNGVNLVIINIGIKLISINKYGHNVKLHGLLQKKHYITSCTKKA